MGLKIANNAYSRLVETIDAAATQVTLIPGEGARFPALGTGDWFNATILSLSGQFEIVRVTARIDDTLTIERGAEDTTPIPFPANSRIELRVTKDNVDISNFDVLLL